MSFGIEQLCILQTISRDEYRLISAAVGSLPAIVQINEVHLKTIREYTSNAIIIT